MTTKPFDIVNYIHNEKDIEEYLKVAFESGDEQEITRALANVIRVRGMSKTSKKTGLNRSNLYKTLINNGGSPTLTTFNKLIRSFGYKLTIAPLP